MKLRGIFSSWIIVVIVLALMLIVIPSTFKSSLMDKLDEWFDEYTEAIEEAQNKEDDDDDDDDDEHIIESMMVRIDDELSDYAGIETLQLPATSFIPEVKTLASVIDIRPMLTLRARYEQALSALNVAKVTERSAAEEVKRLKSLAKGTSSVATKKVNYAEAAWREKNAKLQGLNFDVQAIKNEVNQSWGTEISSWILSAKSKQWNRLLSHQDSLLLVTLPADVSLPVDVSFIRITQNNSQKIATKAYFVSPAITVDKVVQGETYFFKTTNESLRSGMRLNAWLPEHNEPLDGVFIPESSVVWNAGQPWVYIQIGDDLYQRHSLQSGLNIRDDIFMEQGIDVGTEIVIKGAQMLLSEEFKWQILDEDDDD